MRKLAFLTFLLCPLFIYAQNPNDGQILDGNKPFVLRFNFVHLEDKYNGTYANMDVKATVRFTPGAIKGQGTITLNHDGEISEDKIYDIQPIMIEGITHYIGLQKENGMIVATATWSSIAFHSVDAQYTVSYGVKVKRQF